MIKYKLICKNCDLNFDSWFASSNEYERLKKKKHLTGESRPQVIKLKEHMILMEEDHQFGMYSVTQKVKLKMEIRVILHVITTTNFLRI